MKASYTRTRHCNVVLPSPFLSFLPQRCNEGAGVIEPTPCLLYFEMRCTVSETIFFRLRVQVLRMGAITGAASCGAVRLLRRGAVAAACGACETMRPVAALLGSHARGIPEASQRHPRGIPEAYQRHTRGKPRGKPLFVEKIYVKRASAIKDY